MVVLSFFSCHILSFTVSFLHRMLFSHDSIPHLSCSPLVTILPQPSMRFYGPCSLKDTINTASFCTPSLKLDLHSSALQSSPVALYSTLHLRDYLCLLLFDYKSSIALNISRREDHLSSTILILSATRKDVGLFMSIAHPGSIKDRSVVVSKVTLSHP